MKSFYFTLCLIGLIFLSNCISSERSLKVTLRGGDLKEQYSYPEKIRTLTIEGDMDAADFAFIRDRMPLLDSLNLRNVNCRVIPKNAFSVWDKNHRRYAPLRIVVLPEGLITIGKEAFFGCKNLQRIENVQPTLQTIEESAFALTPVKWDSIWLSHLTFIGQTAFSGNSSVQGSLFIPSTCRITGSSFAGCPIRAYCVDREHSGLMSEDGVLYNRDQTVLLTYPYEKRDTQFIVPKSVKVIGQIVNPYLKSIVLPDGLESIGYFCFEGIFQLEQLEIPASVEHFHGAPYAECKKLKTLIMKHTTPPQFDPRCKYPKKRNVRLIVPKESESLYRQSPIWSGFTNIIGQ